LNKGKLNPDSGLPERAKALETLLSNLPGAAYECSPGAPWIVHYISDGVMALTGYPSESFTSHEFNWADITHPDDFPALSALVDEALSAQRQFSTSYRIICASFEKAKIITDLLWS
jgi:PAS domain-containing protein